VAGLRVLITNLVLLGRSGTETYVRDLALALKRRGHHPVVYSPRTGAIAGEIRDAGVPVRERLADIEERPDVIHGHHTLPTMSALLRFPGVPAVFVSHSSQFWADAPVRFPRIRRYVAVDHLCRERLVAEGLPERLVRVVPNAVDLDRFKPRGPLPARPRRALLFSNYANEHTHLPVVRKACARTGLELEVVGSGVNAVCEHPEAILGEFDLVFAKARCALEALAVGAAVVLCGPEGSGPLVRPDAVAELRRLNFGRGTLVNPLTTRLLVEQIARYDPREAAAATAWVRAQASLDGMVTELLSTYADALADAAPAAPDAAVAEAWATADYLQSIEPTLFATFAADDLVLHLKAEVRRLAAELHRPPPVPLRARARQLVARMGASRVKRGWRWLRTLPDFGTSLPPPQPPSPTVRRPSASGRGEGGAGGPDSLERS
jgi:Glycosyltransferase Family 4